MRCSACNHSIEQSWGRCTNSECPSNTHSIPSGTITDVLDARGKKYGDVNVQARIFCDIVDAMGKSARVSGLHPVARQSLYIMALKMSRVVAGGNSEPDNWVDIQGYAKLAEGETP